MFTNLNYSDKQIEKYYQAAAKDLSLAFSTSAPELAFYACFNVIIKIAMAVCAKNNLKVKSRTGHHTELINKLASYLNDDEILIIASKIKTKRNRDLYDGGTETSEKEAAYYLEFCDKLIKQADVYLFPNRLL